MLAFLFSSFSPRVLSSRSSFLFYALACACVACAFVNERPWSSWTCFVVVLTRTVFPSSPFFPRSKLFFSFPFPLVAGVPSRCALSGSIRAPDTDEHRGRRESRQGGFTRAVTNAAAALAKRSTPPARARPSAPPIPARNDPSSADSHGQVSLAGALRRESAAQLRLTGSSRSRGRGRGRDDPHPPPPLFLSAQHLPRDDERRGGGGLPSLFEISPPPPHLRRAAFECVLTVIIYAAHGGRGRRLGCARTNQ